MSETIQVLVGHFQDYLKSDDLGVRCLFDIMRYEVKVNGEVIGHVVVHGIVYYDFSAHDLFFDIEHQLYLC